MRPLASSGGSVGHDEWVSSPAETPPGQTSTGQDPRPGLGLLPTGAAFLAVAAVLVLAFDGLRQVSAFAAPIFLALTLVLTVDPLRRAMVARGVPLWLATVSMLLLLYTVLLAVIFGIGIALSQLVTVLPEYQDEFTALYQDGVDLLERAGIEVGTIQEVVRGVEPASALPFVGQVLGGVGSVSMTILFLGLGVAFLTLDLAHAGRRLAYVERYRPELASALRTFAKRIGRYWGVSTIFGLAQAALDVILLYILGVPLPFVWGMLAFLTAYIPNIGFVIGLVPPALLGLLTGGVGTMIAVIVGYMLISFVTQTLIMPKFAGEAVGLNITATFVSLIFWSAVIGPLGALLAIPLTLFAKAVLVDSHPRSQWLGSFLASSDLIEEPSRHRSGRTKPRRHT